MFTTSLPKVASKGTGVTREGEFITIDWNKSVIDPDHPENNDFWFTRGIGANVEPWKTVATANPQLPSGTMIIIEFYQEKGVFRVTDTGYGLQKRPEVIDVFVGEMTLAEVDALEVEYSRVWIVR